MSEHDAEDMPHAPWGVTAAYLYTLELDGPSLGWEYLRRNPKYRRDWRLQRTASFERWGLQSS